MFASCSSVLCSGLTTHAFQVNLAKLDAYARMEGNSNQGGQRLSKKVMSVQASNILAARAKLEDAMWEPWLRAKVLRTA